MKYPLLIVSRIEANRKDKMVILTFYPSDSACITTQEDGVLAASYVKHFSPGIGLAEALSEKGKRRLKVILRQPSFTDNERITLGTLYFSLLFGQNPGDDDAKMRGSDALYDTVCDLFNADASSEATWSKACAESISKIELLAKQFYH